MDLAYTVSLHILKSFLTCSKILQHGANGFTCLKEGMLRIFIIHKNPSPSAGFEPMNLVTNGKHANY
jgi:hypothetical protein